MPKFLVDTALIRNWLRHQSKNLVSGSRRTLVFDRHLAIKRKGGFDKRAVELLLCWASESMEFFRSVNLTEVIGPFAVLAVIILFALLWYAREGRNGALENIIVQSEFGPPALFRGSLVVEESQPSSSLRLCKSSTAARWLQFRYRWFGVGKQAIFDEVTFDGSRCLVEMEKENTQTTAGFSEFSAIRMRETSGGRGGGSLWHVELVSHRRKAIPFVTSEIDSRKTAFEQTASVAKAVSAIMGLPVQVFVAGNIWTPGWPPKASIDSKSR